MKEITCSKKYKLFECSVCSKRYEYPNYAEQCEEKHKQTDCKHSHLEFMLDSPRVEVVCKDCGAYMGEKYLEKSADKEIEKLAKKLFFESSNPLETGSDSYWGHITVPEKLFKTVKKGKKV